MMQIKEVLDDLDEEEGELEKAVTEAEVKAIPVGQISIKVWCGSGNNKTMLIMGNCGRTKLCILVDSGSTHNFLNERVTRQLGYKIIEVLGI